MTSFLPNVEQRSGGEGAAATNRPRIRIQFRLQGLLSFMAATAVILAISRWINARQVRAEEYLPLFIGGSISLTLLTAMGWILLGAGRRISRSRLRAISLLLGVAPLVWWITCLASLPTLASENASSIVGLIRTAGAIGSAISFPLQWLAIAINLRGAVDRLLLAAQLTIVVLTFTGIYLAFTLWSLQLQ